MGGFAAILGHAASGFEQARQQDLQRQFADEQNRRNAMGEFLNSLATREDVPEEIRSAAGQGVLKLGQHPWNKPLKSQDYIDPLLAASAARHGQQAQFTPPPIPDMQLGGQTIMGQPSRTVQLSEPPPPPGQFYMTPEEHTAFLTQRASAVAGAQAGGATTGQIEARHAAYNSIPGFSSLPAQSQAILISGGSLLPMMRSIGSGAGFAKDFRAAGDPVPPGIPDDAWVNKKELAGGTATWELAAAPGQKAEGNQLLGPLELEKGKQQIDLPFYQKKVGMQLAKSLQLQQNGFNLAIQRGALGEANQIYMKNWEDLQKRVGALTLMEQNYKAATQPGPAQQQAMVSLLFNHIGMTSGAVPGSRQSRATIEEAEKSTPWIQGMIAKWFHYDAADDKYVFDGLKGGVNLTKDQMDQMVDLARNRVGVQRQVLQSMSEAPGFNGEPAPPGVSAIGGYNAGKPSKKGSGSTVPPAPPSTTGKSWHDQFNTPPETK